MEMEERVLNLSNSGIRKLDKIITPVHPQQVTTLNINSNNLQRLDNIDVFCSLTDLSANHNQLLRMYYVSKLRNLVNLDLSNNHILHIEGLKELKNLKMLNLSFNNIKLLDASHLQTNLQLEHLDLSCNSIVHISNISFLVSLRRLFLHKNQITHLRHCELYLPISLENLTLNNNCIADLNEVSHLVQLYNLSELSFAGNPCLTMTGNVPGFDYRPFIINWCLNLRLVDGYVVDDLERLKAEWLYSQGRGRKFRVGEHIALVKYLTETCPMTSKALESEQERKLRVVLSKAQQYQKQLSHDQPEKCNTKPEVENKRLTPSSTSRTSLMSRSFDPSLLNKRIPAQHDSDIASFLYRETNLSRSINYPTDSFRCNSERGRHRQLPRNGSKSVHVTPPRSTCSIPKSASKTPKVLNTSTPIGSKTSSRKTNSSKSMYVIPKPNPLPSTSILLPAPDSIVSPGNINSVDLFVSPISVSKPDTIAEIDCKVNTLESSPLISRSITIPMEMPRINTSQSNEKLENIQEPRTSESMEQINKNNDNRDYAATCIQKVWRGYHTRVLNRRVTNLVQHIQTKRFNEYIRKLNTEMEATREALAKEHQLQILQMEAINALWKKIATLQMPTPVIENCSHSSNVTQSPTDKITIKALATTCTNLDSQVQQLQNAMRDILRHVNQSNSNNAATAISTQTEIVAVHTPSEENSKQFPYQKLTPRPSSLPLPSFHSQKKNHYMSNISETTLNKSIKSQIDPCVNGDVASTNSEMKVVDKTKRETSC